MKKRIVVLFIIVGLVWLVRTQYAEQALDLIAKAESLFRPKVNAKAAILIDSSTGNVIYSQDADTSYPVASMSKLMTQYLLLEAVKEKRVGWSDRVRISPNAAGAEGAGVPLLAGETYPLYELYQAMVIGSANNAAVAIGEYLGGSTQQFAQMMNQKAMKMKLQSAQFVNASGLAYLYGQNQMSARDVSILARQLITDFPEVLDLTREPFVLLPTLGESVVNTNEMLVSAEPHMQVEGMDGLKTGYTDQAGYCFTGTARQGETRLISVIMGAATSTDRFTETKKLMDYGFQQH